MDKIEKSLLCFIIILSIIIFNFDGKYQVCNAENIYNPEYQQSNLNSDNFHIKCLLSCDNRDENEKYSYEVNLKMNNKWFLEDNSKYNSELSNTSLLLSSLAYHKNASDSEGSSDRTYDLIINGEKYGIQDIMQYMGFNNVKEYNTNDYYDGEHQSQFDIGYRKIEDSNKEKNLVLITVRGTYGTLGEWTSNFDIGDTEEECAEWNNDTRYNHKGFDITSDRVKKLIDSYILENNIQKNNDTVFWITGHSRGGAVANIVAAKMEDEHLNVFAYTFASPNTTTKSSAKDYKGIFNIVNEDDIIPELPLKEWGFMKYGKTAVIDMTREMKKEWEKNTGIFSYIDESKDGLDTTLKSLAGIMKNRNDCKKYEENQNQHESTSCFYSWADIYHHNLVIENTPQNAKNYEKITQNNFGFEINQTPMFFMQFLAAYMCDDITLKSFITYDIAPKYQEAKNRLLVSGNPVTGGLDDAHYTDSYYIIEKNVSENDFK